MTAVTPRPLNAERIVKTALAIIDADGIAGFTLGRVAAALGVRAPSLYNHVASKAAIVEGVRDLVVSEMDYSAFETLPWDAALQRFARSYRSAFAAHPNTVPLLFTTPVGTLATFRMYEAVTSAMVDAGWPDDLTVPVLASLEYLIAGSVLDRSAQGLMFGRASELGAPTVALSQRHHVDQVAQADQHFEVGLRALLDGLRVRFRELPLELPEPQLPEPQLPEAPPGRSAGG
jgi:AcrR family transcriptional regulator